MPLDGGKCLAPISLFESSIRVGTTYAKPGRQRLRREVEIKPLRAVVQLGVCPWRDVFPRGCRELRLSCKDRLRDRAEKTSKPGTLSYSD